MLIDVDDRSRFPRMSNPASHETLSSSKICILVDRVACTSLKDYKIRMLVQELEVKASDSPETKSFKKLSRQIKVLVAELHLVEVEAQLAKRELQAVKERLG